MNCTSPSDQNFKSHSPDVRNLPHMLHGVQLAPADKYQVVAQIPPTVPLGHIGLLALQLGVNKGVLHAELEPLPIRLKGLLAEVVIDEDRLQSQVARTVQVGSLFLRRLS